MIDALRRRLARPARSKANAARARGDWAAALQAYEQAASIIGRTPGLALQIGNMQTELGAYDAARASFEAARADPAYALKADIGIAGVAERAGDWAGAVTAWEGVVRRMADEEALGAATDWPLTPAAALLHIAKCREHIGDGSGSERDFALALILDPAIRKSREAVLMRARMLARTSRVAAYRLLARSHRRYPEDRGIGLSLIKTAVELGFRDEAAGFARPMLAAEPDDPLLPSLLREHGITGLFTSSQDS